MLIAIKEGRAIPLFLPDDTLRTQVILNGGIRLADTLTLRNEP